MEAPAVVAPAPSLPALIETVDITTPVISPDGKRVAFRQGRATLDSNRYELTWWVAPIDRSAPPVKVGDGGTALWKSEGVPVVEAPVWQADSRRIYYRALRDQQVQVWRSSVEGAGSEQVTRDDADVDRFVIEAPQRLVYTVRATRAELLARERRLYDQGVLIDATVDPSQALFQAVEINGRMASERFSGRWFQRDGLAMGTPDRFKTLDLATLTEVEQTRQNGPGRSPPGDVFAAVKTLSTASSERFGQVRVTFADGRYRLEVQRPGGDVVTCAAKVCDLKALTWVAWRPDRDEVVFAGRDESRRLHLGRWTVGGPGREVLSLQGDLGGGAYGQACAISADSAVCVHAAALSPPRLERIDLENGARTLIAAPNGHAINDPDIDVEHLVWRDAEGRLFTGELVAPTTSGRTPLFVNYYGCDGYLRGGVGDEWPFIAFAKAGISALCINTTRADPKDLDSVADYEVALGGVRAAIDLLEARGRIDRKRVGMGGVSFGTEVTVWVARKSDLLAAASIASVLIEPSYYWLNGVAGRDVHDGLRQAWRLGAPDETPDRWRLVSPALDIEAFKTPLLMQYPEQEFRPTIEFFARLSNSTTPVELHVFPQERHILAQPRHRLAAYTRNLDWFRYWLQNQIDPAPDKAEQYRRWSSMAKAHRSGRP
jgi:dipeptidyl aminopeptidase/acylaminoacyl peptidase